MKTLNKSEEFFKIICNYNPYFSSLMDKDVPKLPDFSETNIISTIEDLQKLLDDMITNIENEEERYLYHSILTTKYFLENSILWNNPIYYYSRLQQNLEVCYNGYSVIHGELSKCNVLETRITYVEQYIDEIIHNMSNIELGKMDCIYGIKMFQGMKEGVFKHSKNLKISIPIETIHNALDKICVFLEEKKKQSTHIFIPYGEEILGSYLRSETGLIFTVDNLREILYTSLEIQVQCQCNKVNVYTSDINDTLNKIIEVGKEVFGCDHNIEETITFQYFSNNDNTKLNYIGYLPNSVNTEECKGTFIFNDKYFERNKYDQVLGLIHEIYPGHHYMNCINRNQNKGNISKILYESTAYTEGWAKYCEFVFAYRILEDMEYSKAFNEQMKRVSTIAIVSFELHCRKKQYQDLIQIINRIDNSLSSEKINSIILQAYINPVECISIVMGFMFFYSHYGININTKTLKKIYEEGAWIMKEKEVSFNGK